MTSSMRILIRKVATLALLAVVYFVSAKLGLRLAFFNASATAVWPPTGIALAALLILGYDAWPAIFVGAFLANILTAGSAATSLGIAFGNTLEAVAGAYLVNRYAGGRTPFDRAEQFFKFVLLAALLSTTLSPTIGITSLALGGFASWPSFGRIWVTWWLGDAVGAMVVAPVVLLWGDRPYLGWRRSMFPEAGGLFAVLILSGALAFGGSFPSPNQGYPLEFLCLPPLLWAAFRFGPRIASAAVLLLSGIAVFGTIHGYGPFARSSPDVSMFLVQSYTGIAAITTLALAVVAAERRAMEEQLRQLSMTDPLTGLANYRLLMDRLSTERARSERTGRSFALIFLDVDGLKRINDQYGHLTGSRALCRVADALRVSCRGVMDVAARYGGDEFAVVIPEIDGEIAARIARRILDTLARDGGTPPVRVSLGVAMYPQHGDTPEELIRVADRTLYAMKVGDGLLGSD